VNLIEIGWEGDDWIYLDEDRGEFRAVMNTVMKLRVP
jgi:hypothetical protein